MTDQDAEMQDNTPAEAYVGKVPTNEPAPANKKRKQQFNTEEVPKRRSNHIIPILRPVQATTTTTTGSSVLALNNNLQKPSVQGAKKRSNRNVPYSVLYLILRFLQAANLPQSSAKTRDISVQVKTRRSQTITFLLQSCSPKAVAASSGNPTSLVNTNLQQIMSSEDKQTIVSVQDRLDVARRLGTPVNWDTREKWHPLSIQGDNRTFTPLHSRRLKVAGDFGFSDSSIGWGFEANHTTFGHGIKKWLDGNGQGRRIPSVAAVIRRIDDSQGHCHELLFGFAAARHWELDGDNYPVMIDKMNIDFLETDFMDNHPGPIDETVQLAKGNHIRALRAIHEFSNGEVFIKNPLISTYDLHTIKSISCIRREYLRFLLQMVKVALRSEYELELNEVNTTISGYTDVAMSLPAIASAESRQAFKSILTEVSFPQTAMILNEAKSATLYDVLDRKSSTWPI